MPIFEYRCSACDHLEEVLQKHTDPGPAVCPACGKQGTLAKEISATSFQLKGGGWYKDLYASKKTDPTSGGTKSETKTETKSETKKGTSSGSSSGGSSPTGTSSGGSSSGGSSAMSTAA
jgi:putative FmdB family regulatory protein